MLRWIALLLIMQLNPMNGTTLTIRREGLGFGVVSVALPTTLTVEKHRGFEFVSYDLLDRTGKRLMLIYLGSNWDVSALRGSEPIRIRALRGVATSEGKGPRFSRVVVLNLPKGSADRLLVYKYENLTATGHRTVTDIIGSTEINNRELGRVGTPIARLASRGRVGAPPLRARVRDGRR